MSVKTCTKCGVEKPLGDYSPNRHRTDGRQSWCRSCVSEHRKTRRDSDDTYDRIYRRAHFRASQILRGNHEAEFRRLLDAEMQAEWRAYRRQRTIAAAAS